MKKQLFIIAGLFLLCSCGGHNAEKMREDSIRRADSLAAAEATAEQERIEAMQRDSIVAANAGQKYDNAISITPGKKNKKHVPESSFYSIQWPCTITNNTDITLSPDDYQISFVETYEGQDKYGDFVDKNATRTIQGPELAPGASAEVVLKGKDATQDLSKPSVKLTISKEDFISKFKDVKN